ncbi:MAG: CpaF family protein [Clostridiales bacterium]|nr:CpaF family protein [Clostridiales bacterium]
MPVIKTHHKLLMKEAQQAAEDRTSNDINTVVTNITFDILRDSPSLVADVASGAVGRELLQTAIIKDMDKHKYHYGLYREELIRKVFDFMFGYGELQPYIEDEDVTDIDGTRYNEFFIKKKGERFRIPVNLGSEKIFDTYCKLVAIRNRGILNENDSHCRVTDEKLRLRINVAIKPRNITGPSISIRKHRMRSYSLDELSALGMFKAETCMLLKKIAKTNSSVVFCGKGAAGKTTLMRAFINELPERERVLIMESDAEIFPDKPCCIEQRVRKPNEGGRPVSLRDLIRDGLTMSLDTYCIGEIVGEEAWEFVKCGYTGHRALGTTHCDNAAGVFGRLLTLSKSANIGESEKTVKEIMGESLDYIVFLKDFKISGLLEVQGYDGIVDSFRYNTLIGGTD